VRKALAEDVRVIDAPSMRDAVERGYEAARPDGVVLLAPACSSFDWFPRLRGARGRLSSRKWNGCARRSGRDRDRERERARKQ